MDEDYQTQYTIHRDKGSVADVGREADETGSKQRHWMRTGQDVDGGTIQASGGNNCGGMIALDPGGRFLNGVINRNKNINSNQVENCEGRKK